MEGLAANQLDVADDCNKLSWWGTHRRTARPKNLISIISRVDDLIKRTKADKTKSAIQLSVGRAS